MYQAGFEQCIALLPESAKQRMSDCAAIQQLGMDSCAAGTAGLNQSYASTDMLAVDDDSCWVQWMTRVGGSLGWVPSLCPVGLHAKVCSICLHVVSSYDGAGMEVLAYDLPAR